MHVLVGRRRLRTSTHDAEREPTRCAQVAGGLYDELQNLQHAMFNGLELDRQWANVFRVFAEGVEEIISSAASSTLAATKSFVPSSIPYTASGASGRAAKVSQPAVAKQQLLRRIVIQTYYAVVATVRGLLSYRRFGVYLKNRGLDLVGRTLCVISLVLSQMYNIEDYQETTITFFHKEAILSYTVIFLWIRQLKVLTVSSTSGAFVYMIGRMIQDVLRWFLVFFFCALSWAAGFLVLFRNRRAGIGPHYGAHYDKCENIELKLGETFSSSFLFLFQITLDGSGTFWDCVIQSGYQQPGLLLSIIFLVIVVIVLLNTLIAMMAETFANVTREAFSNYAFAFGKTLMQMRGRSDVAVPLNLLAIPFSCGRFLYGAFNVPYRFKSLRKAYHLSHAPAARDGRQPSVLMQSAVDALEAAFKRSRDKLRKVDESGRDPEVTKRIDDIRLLILKERAKKLHFERSVARFCRVQV